MTASASDLRSVLAIPQATPGPSLTRKAPGPRKPEGISRELYSLIGDNVPPLSAQFLKPKLKQKPAFARAITRWEWKPFKSSARPDGLQLSHWHKVGSSTEQEDYPFARYNTTIPTYTYSLDEYTRLLEEETWTKEETDYLFELVKEYDMKWYVINDRYEFPGGPDREIDDLKARYYSVCKKLIKTRPWAGDEASRTALANAYTFDKGREVTRKNYLRTLASRTAEQIAEEESLFIEIKKLEQTERRFAKEREDLLKLLLGIDSGVPSVQTDDEGQTAMVLAGEKKKGKRRVDGLEVDTSLAANLSLAPSQSLRKSTTVKSSAHDVQHCIHRFEAAGGPSNPKVNTTPVYLRSSRMPEPRINMATKIYAVLDEMGIGYTRLVMPTRSNISQLELLFEAAEALIETKRAVDRVDQELRVAKNQLRMRNGEESMDVDNDNETDAREDGGEEEDRHVREPLSDVGSEDAEEPNGEGQAVGDEDDAEAEAELDDDGEGDAEGEGEGDGEGDGEEGEGDDADGDGDEVDADAEGDADFAEELHDVEDEASDVAREKNGRKRRAMSTSSMDTSATNLTRRSSKRNRQG